MSPKTEITKYIIDYFMKMLTNEAIIIPINPIIKNEPNFVKSLLVVYPYKLIAPKVIDVIKNTLSVQ
jgi:hypothetical protein